MIKISLFFLLYTIPNIFITLRFCIIIFITFIYYHERFIINLLTTDMIKVIFEFISIIENINNLVIP